MVSLSDYDIAGRVLVFTAPATTPAAPLGQLRREGVPDAIGLPRLPTDVLHTRPVGGIHGRRLRHQPVPLFRRPRTTADALDQFGIPLPQSGRLCGAKRQSQGRIVLSGVRAPGGTRLPRPVAATWLLRPGPATAATPLPGIMRVRSGLPGGLRAVAQQPVPVKGQVRMCVFKRLTHFRIQRPTANLDMRRRPEQVQQFCAGLS